jgi:hypothetical protein
MKYLNWPLSISTRALARVEAAIEGYLSGKPEDVELRNIANEVRAMLQKPQLLAKAPEPEDDLLS